MYQFSHGRGAILNYDFFLHPFFSFFISFGMNLAGLLWRCCSIFGEVPDLAVEIFSQKPMNPKWKYKTRKRDERNLVY